MSKYISLIYKILFIGLLLQFVVFNLFTYSFGLEGGYIQYIRLWKEILIILLILLILRQSIVHNNLLKLIRSDRRGWIQLGLIVLIGLTAYIDLGIHQQSLGTYAMAFKYDLFGFLIFFVGLHSSKLLDYDHKKDLISRYSRIIKRLLGLALVRYLIIAIKPGTLKILGYDNYVFEGVVGSASPAAYYTEINQGLTRNQFLFERPVQRGFFLTAFWPLFFLMFLYKQPLSRTWGRRGLYGINIFLTFSRAARGSWIVLCFVLGILIWRHNKLKLLAMTIAPIIALIAGFVLLGGSSLLSRGYSDTGHITMIYQGRDMVIQKPLLGRGGASVGPGSHHGGLAFNPENQFLQIRIEYGSIVFLLRLLIFFGITQKSFWSNSNISKAFALGMIGLAISGMVLHSFSDRMIVYPFMLLRGIRASNTFAPKT